jgi:esterase/lipase superfamily enzyme
MIVPRLRLSLGLSLALVAGLLLSGCAGRATGVLEPVATAQPPGASTVPILVATTRQRSADPGQMFSGERAVAPTYAEIDVSIPPDAAREIGDVQWPQSRPGDPAREFVVVGSQTMPQQGGLTRLRERLGRSGHRRVLVFVHGYNTRFEEAVFRLAQIAHDSEAKAQPVLFTWPSRGKLLAYVYDRESANYSRDALEQMLASLQRESSVREITILAHSMGNWVTLEALRQMAIRNGAIASKITQVMLAAPDVDVDVFARQIAEIGPKRPPFTLFASTNDEALGFSQRLAGGVERLGSVDPNEEPWRSKLAAERIAVVDLSDVKSSDKLNHTTFASADVVRSIGVRLSSGQKLHDGGAGLGDRIAQVTAGAAATVGAAAGLAVSAPLAVVDGRTRESLGDQFEQVGAGLGQTAGGFGVGGSTRRGKAQP